MILCTPQLLVSVFHRIFSSVAASYVLHGQIDMICQLISLLITHEFVFISQEPLVCVLKTREWGVGEEVGKTKGFRELGLVLPKGCVKSYGSAMVR